jgi:hypothetical protein
MQHGSRIKTNAAPQLKPLTVGLAMALSLGATQGFAADGGRPNPDATPFAQRGKPAHQLQLRRGDIANQILEAKLERIRAKITTVKPTRPAATLPVTSCDDDGSAGTLRSVVSGAAEGDTIDLSALTCSTITLQTGGVAVNADDLTIVGPGSTALTIDANNGGTAFDHYSSGAGVGTLSIQGLSITNGYYSGAGGGAIWANGNISLTDVSVTNSSADGKYANGGGVYTRGNLTLSNSTISGNRITSTYYNGTGGGAYAAGDVTITDSTISGNIAESTDVGYGYGVGGGIFAAGNTTIVGSTVSGNQASYGGGLANVTDGTTFTASNSTISGNTADLAGGGMFVFSKTSLRNSTITQNTAYDGAGVIDLHYAYEGPADLQSTIIFGNSATGSGGNYDADFGMFEDSVTGANNLIGAANGVSLPADTLNADPLLGPLASNGGPTQTHMPGTGSPVIDAGNNNAALDTDQRGAGFPRVSGAEADIGSVEVQSGTTPQPAAPPRELPTLSQWALMLMAGLLAAAGFRRSRRDERENI